MRKKLFIDKAFQLRFMVTLLVPILIIDLFFLVAIEYNFRELASQALADGLEKNHQFFKLLSYQKWMFEKSLMVVSGVTALIMLIWGVYTSHRIAGPLKKLENKFNQYQNLAEAKDEKISFRRNDYFQDLPKAFNDFIKRISP